MYKLSNDTLQNFLDQLIEAIKDENEDRKDKELSDINIPFILSAPYQSFGNDTNKYQEFIQDLNDYPDYNVIVSESKDDYNGIIDVEINLVKDNTDYNRDDDYYNYDYPNYNYLLCFSYDDRDYGYCECTPDMPDYREDKHCCGHGCDASFCSFSLHKVLNVVSDSWHGDEHDYWEFEDEYYASDKDLANKKREENRAREIEELKNRISADSKRLAELTGNEVKENN